MCEFRCSDIVECVDDTPLHAESRTMPRQGQLYTVSAVRRAGDGHSVRLRELAPSCWRGGPCGCGECGWDAARFRKVYRPGDVALRALLAPVDEQA